MNRALDFIDQRTGLLTPLADWLRRPVAGGPKWRFVWPSTIVFGFLTQAVTGMALWMYYVPSPMSAWESVYYIEHHVQGGCWLRAIHHYSAQVTLVLVGLYFLQMIVRGAYRGPREFLYWTVLLMALVTLGLNLTGDLLPWDQNSYWATHVRTGFLNLLPGIGGVLFNLAAGGAEFGQLTLARFVALHVGLFTAAFLCLLVLHAWLARRHGLEEPVEGRPAASYWPGQAARDMMACAAVLAVVLVLAACCGTDLGAPANPAEDPGTARPEWSFRGLYQFRELFPSSLEIVPIFGISGLTVLVFFLMPWIGRRPAGRWFNVAFTAVVFGGLAALSWQSYRLDARDEKYQQNLAAGREAARRVKLLADSPQMIPPTGALTLLAEDPKTQGPRLFELHCAACHGSPGNPREDTTAPDLTAFARREWFQGILDPKQVAGPKYFGNTKFKKSPMVTFVKENAESFDPEEIETVVLAVSAEAGLRRQEEADRLDAGKIAAGRALLTARKADCTGCHTWHGKGTAQGPDLTGYGNRQWLIEIIGNPAQERFYGEKNDRMPSYAGTPSDPGSRILSDREIGLMADWLRGEWYEP
ncbi:MAG: cytochrome b N-terminal domain-containing protein [Thermoguttaceae bacterium]|jgi:ubiquinol-cytochrome c reductase cytochrome b subunit